MKNKNYSIYNMSVKQTLEFWNNLADSREHQLINVSNPTYIRDGTITLKCKCEYEFTTSAKSYYTSKNGCPSCKKRRISETKATLLNVALLKEGKILTKIVILE